MKPRIKRGKGFRGVLQYALDPAKGPEIVGGNMTCETPRDLAREFGAVRQLRPSCDKPVWHCSLSLPDGERLDSAAWGALVDDYLQLMGIDPATHPNVVVRHTDTDHDHVHIIASRISVTGDLWHGANDAKLAKRACAEIERQHGLTLTYSESEPHTPTPTRIEQDEREMWARKGEAVPPKALIAGAIEQALASGPIRLERLVADLADAGIKTNVNRASTGRIAGLSFEVAAAGERCVYRASQLGKSYGWAVLSHRLDLAPQDTLSPPAQSPAGADRREASERATVRPSRHDRDAAQAYKAALLAHFYGQDWLGSTEAIHYVRAGAGQVLIAMHSGAMIIDRDDSITLARGDETNIDAIDAMIAGAQAHGWTSIQLDGAVEFRRAAALAALAAGLNVEDEDLQQLVAEWRAAYGQSGRDAAPSQPSPAAATGVDVAAGVRPALGGDQPGAGEAVDATDCQSRGAAGSDAGADQPNRQGFDDNGDRGAGGAAGSAANVVAEAAATAAGAAATSPTASAGAPSTSDPSSISINAEPVANVRADGDPGGGLDHHEPCASNQARDRDRGLSRFKKRKKYEGAPQKAVVPALMISREEIADVRQLSPRSWLEANGYRVQGSEARGEILVEGRWRISRQADGHWVACDWAGTGVGDNVALVQAEAGCGFVDAVRQLATDAPRLDTTWQPRPVTPPKLPIPRPEDKVAGRQYLRSRHISPAAIEAAEKAGMLSYCKGGVLFTGRDSAGVVRSATVRATDAKSERPKRDLAGTDKTYPPILPGDHGRVHLVEGGADALALWTLFTARNERPPTIIVTGGAGVYRFLDRPEIQNLLSFAERIRVWREHEKEADTQAKTDAGHSRQADRIKMMNAAAIVDQSLPAEGKDIADWLRIIVEREARPAPTPFPRP